MHSGTNAPGKPEFEGQIVKFISPHNSKVILYDIAQYNKKYGWLEWIAINEPTEQQIKQSFWIEQQTLRPGHTRLSAFLFYLTGEYRSLTNACNRQGYTRPQLTPRATDKHARTLCLIAGLTVAISRSMQQCRACFVSTQYKPLESICLISKG